MAVAATKALHQGRLALASKIVTSNGAVPRSAATADVMVNMHTSLHTPLVLAKPTCAQLRVPTECCTVALLQAAGSSGSMVFFGWSDDYYLHIRCLKDAPATPSLLFQVARLQSVLADARIPTTFSTLFVTAPARFATATNCFNSMLFIKLEVKQNVFALFYSPSIPFSALASTCKSCALLIRHFSNGV